VQEVAEVLSRRNGAVLGAATILKADSYPSLRSRALPQWVPGAPNLRQAGGGAPVFGVGIPSAAGAAAALDALRAAGSHSMVWHNLREEPVLYINGAPYVLREAAGAYRNMQEYSGIDGGRLEALEARLKAEAKEKPA
jgi:Inositol hexakisphosphate